MCEDGLWIFKNCDIWPLSQKECLTLWLKWCLKGILKSKCVVATHVEECKIIDKDWVQNVWEGNKTRFNGKGRRV